MIHVQGPKQNSDLLNHDEALCSTTSTLPPDTLVVFHPRAVKLTGGGFSCPDCGVSSRDPKGSA